MDLNKIKQRLELLYQEVKELEASGESGTSDYSDLTNKPSINNVTLSGNKSLSDLGIAPSASSYDTGDTAETTLADADKFPFYDDSASAKRSSTWSNIKSKLKTYFDTLYSTVKTRETPASGGTTLSLVNTGDMYTWNNKVGVAGTGLSKTSSIMSIKEFASGDMDEVLSPLPSSAPRYNVYSTEEQVIGQWIDGKTIYQKSFTGTLTATTAVGTEVGTSISIGATVQQFVSIEGYVDNGSGTVQFISEASVSDNKTRWLRFSANTNSISDSASRNVIIIGNSWFTTAKTYYVTVRYTKTT